MNRSTYAPRSDQIKGKQQTNRSAKQQRHEDPATEDVVVAIAASIGKECGTLDERKE
jgi:hypothetical protein